MMQRSSGRSRRTTATQATSTTTPTEPSGIECLERAYSLSVKEGWFTRAETPPRERPPDLTRDELGRLDPQERLRYDEARSVWHANIGPIHTPRMDAVLEDIGDIVEANRQDGDKVKSSPVLDAYPGLGKSTLAVEYGAEFHRRQIELYGRATPEGHQRVPVAYVALTSSTSMKSLNSMLCRFYGHPGADRGNAERVGSMARQCVLECQTRLIIVDDIHFLDMNRHDGREVANHFKWLANQFPVTLFFVGVGLRQRGLLDEGLRGCADRRQRNVAKQAAGPMVTTSPHVLDHRSPDACRPIMLPRSAVGPVLRPSAPATGVPSPGLPPTSHPRPRRLRQAGPDAQVRLQLSRDRRPHLLGDHASDSPR
jgi:hypothetical protein